MSTKAQIPESDEVNFVKALNVLGNKYFSYLTPDIEKIAKLKLDDRFLYEGFNISYNNIPDAIDALQNISEDFYPRLKYALLFICNFHLRKYHLARNNLNSILELNPFNPWALINLASITINENGPFEEIKRLIEKALNSGKKLGWLHFEIANLYKDYNPLLVEDILKYLENAISFETSTLKVDEYIGFRADYYYFHSGLNDRNELALDDLNKIDYTKPGTLYFRANIYYEQEEYAKALGNFVVLTNDGADIPDEFKHISGDIFTKLIDCVAKLDLDMSEYIDNSINYFVEQLELNENTKTASPSRDAIKDAAINSLRTIFDYQVIEYYKTNAHLSEGYWGNFFFEKNTEVKLENLNKTISKISKFNLSEKEAIYLKLDLLLNICEADWSNSDWITFKKNLSGWEYSIVPWDETIILEVKKIAEILETKFKSGQGYFILAKIYFYLSSKQDPPHEPWDDKNILEAFDKAISIEPGNPNHYELRWRIFMPFSSDKDFDKVIELTTEPKLKAKLLIEAAKNIVDGYSFPDIVFTYIEQAINLDPTNLAYKKFKIKVTEDSFDPNYDL